MDYIYGYIVLLSTLVMMGSVSGIPCGDPGRIPHGNAKYLSGGMLVQFFCDSGYQPLGSPMLSCTRGTWKGKKPVCVAQGCPPIIQVLHGLTIEQMNGAVVSFRCNAGFRMDGESFIHCDGFHWSAPPPICEGTEPVLPDIVIPLQQTQSKENEPKNIVTPEHVVTNDQSEQLPLSSNRVGVSTNNGLRRPIFVSPSEKPPIFHGGMLKKIGAGGVLPLYRDGDSEKEEVEDTEVQHENEAAISPPNQPIREVQLPASKPSLGQNSGRPVVPPLGRPYNQYQNPYMRSSGNYNPYQSMYNPYGRPIRPTGVQSSPYQQNPYGLTRYYRRPYPQTGTSMRPIYLTREDRYHIQWPETRVQQPQMVGQKSQSRGRFPGSTSYVSNADQKKTVERNVDESRTMVVQNRHLGQIPRFSRKKEPRITGSSTNYETKDVVRKSVETSREVIAGVIQVNVRSEDEDTPAEASQHRSCPSAPRPVNGYHITRPLPRDYDTDKYLYLIEYRCNPGLKMIGGDKMSYCMTNGKWSGKRPRCEQIQTCEPGFTLQQNGRCIDVNECAKKNGGCLQGCQNYPGGFFCTCDPGYHRSPDGVSCTDIDECDTASEQLCNHICRNTVGSFSCSCREGYSLMEHDNRTCLDKNECLVNSPCQHLCQNTFGSFRCACKINFRLNEDGRTCSEICQPGYLMVLVEGTDEKECIDENECLEHDGLGNCEQICTNTAGSYSCSCSAGYKLNEDTQTCSDINECKHREVSPCEYGCINTVGSYACSCPEHQVLSEDKLQCIGCVRNSYMSENECAQCPRNSITEESGATSLNQCICGPGHRGSPEHSITCNDINECEDDNYGCSHMCINTPGSVFCRCPDGFTLGPDGRNCEDVDECTTRLGLCGRGGLCRNIGGDYNCTCTRGYTPDYTKAKVCVDIDECRVRNGGCQDRCHNLQPGYRCSCKSDWRLSRDGRTCSPLRGTCSKLEPLANGRILPEAPCVHLGTVISGRYCLYVCNGGYRRVGENRRKCGDNGWTGEPLKCVSATWCPIMTIPESVNVTPPACASNSNIRWMLCMFSCKVSSHIMIGSRTTRCNFNHRWVSTPPTCVPRSETTGSDETPRIQCPKDIDVDLMPGEAMAKVTLPRPVSNMAVTKQRNDGSASVDIFPAGTTSVKFTSTSTDGERQASCVMRVRVRDRAAPVIQRCPGSLTIESHQEFPKISWEPPLFSDNVEVKSVKESRFPRGNITWGTYSISYTASDAAGNMAECAFTMAITRPKNSPKSIAIPCGSPRGPANGRAICQTWARGVYCIPSCNPRYAFVRKPPTYMCDEQGVWLPGRVIPDCVDVRSVKSPKTSHVSSTDTQSVIHSIEPTRATTPTAEVYISVTAQPSTSISRVTSLSASTSTEPTEVLKIKILERPTFFLVPTDESKLTTESTRAYKPTHVLAETQHAVQYRVAQPRLIKLASIEDDCSTGLVPETDESGQITCVECARGTYRPRVKSATTCLPCSIGFYQDRVGMGYCKRCPNYIPHASVYAMRGKEKFIGLKSEEECDRIRNAEQTNMRDNAVKRALKRRSRLLHHR